MCKRMTAANETETICKLKMDTKRKKEAVEIDKKQ